MNNNHNNKPDKYYKNENNKLDEEHGEQSTKQNFYDDPYLGKEWESLISKHKLRYDIWMLLDSKRELNVTQISKGLKHSKSTVSRVLSGMESDGLLVSRRGKIKEGGRERIPPKYYRISEKFLKEEDEEQSLMEIPLDQ